MAAGGLGTMVVAAANQLPPGHDLAHQFLLYIAPSVTVGSTIVWAFAAHSFVRFRKGQQIKAAIRAARRRRDEILNDDHVSEGLKAATKAQFESVMKLSMELEEADMREIKATRID